MPAYLARRDFFEFAEWARCATAMRTDLAIKGSAYAVWIPCLRFDTPLCAPAVLEIILRVGLEEINLTFHEERS